LGTFRLRRMTPTAQAVRPIRAALGKRRREKAARPSDVRPKRAHRRREYG
jgi:hypothetical protein